MHIVHPKNKPNVRNVAWPSPIPPRFIRCKHKLQIIHISSKHTFTSPTKFFQGAPAPSPNTKASPFHKAHVIQKYQPQSTPARRFSESPVGVHFLCQGISCT